MVDVRVEIRGRDRAVGGGVEEHDVGVAARRQPALPREAVQASRSGAAQLHPASQVDPAAEDALGVHERQPHLDAARAGQVPEHAVLAGHPAAGAVVGRDDVDRAVGERPPQRVAVLARAQRRRPHELRAELRVGVELIPEQQMVQQRLPERRLAGVARTAQLGHRVGGREMEDENRAAGQPGDRERAVGGLALHHRRADPGKRRRRHPPGLLELALELRDDSAVLGVHDRHPAAPGDVLHRPKQDVVGQAIGLVAHEELHRRAALCHRLRDLGGPVE